MTHRRVLATQVVRPLPERGAEPFVFNELHFNPGDVHRMFFTIPEGATWVGT